MDQILNIREPSRPSSKQEGTDVRQENSYFPILARTFPKFWSTYIYGVCVGGAALAEYLEQRDVSIGFKIAGLPLTFLASIYFWKPGASGDTVQRLEDLHEMEEEELATMTTAENTSKANLQTVRDLSGRMTLHAHSTALDVRQSSSIVAGLTGMGQRLSEEEKELDALELGLHGVNVQLSAFNTRQQANLTTVQSLTKQRISHLEELRRSGLVSSSILQGAEQIDDALDQGKEDMDDLEEGIRKSREDVLQGGVLVQQTLSDLQKENAKRQERLLKMQQMMSSSGGTI